MVPLLLIAVGLIVVFRANLWNLGYNGQFALAAAFVAGFGPSLVQDVPLWFAFVLLFLLAAAVGAGWAFVRRVPEGALRDERDHHDADDDASSASTSPTT